jgi:hypothetical protein
MKKILRAVMAALAIRPTGRDPYWWLYKNL